jgi:hypothetical protein
MTKLGQTGMCQCCEKSEEMYLLQDIYDDKLTPPFRVCANCLTFLVNLSLTKKQFKNLIKNGHSSTEFLLHGDFYDDEGNAVQPQM